MRTRILGKTGAIVGVIGYGSQSLSLPLRPPESEAIHLLRELVAHGVNFIDTADTYCVGPESLNQNEKLLVQALADVTAPIYISTKGGTVRTEKGWEIDGSPERLYRIIVASHAALGGKEPIFLWQHHWPDARHSIPAVFKSFQRAVDEGLVRHIGVSNYTLEQLKQACDLMPIVSLEAQLNLWHRDPEFNGLLEYCENNNIVFLPYRPMGGFGLAERLGEIPSLAAVARERGISPYRMMIAWHLAKSPAILPIPGSSKLRNILDCLGAAEMSLTADEIKRIQDVNPADLPQRIRPPSWKGTLGLSKKASEPEA